MDNLNNVNSLDSLTIKIIAFNKARGWDEKCSDIAKSITIESAELLEHFQWDESYKGVPKDESKNWEEIGDEVADVFWYLIEFCDSAGLDLKKVVENKMIKNAKKYPAKMFKGKHNDKFYRAQKHKYRNEVK